METHPSADSPWGPLPVILEKARRGDLDSLGAVLDRFRPFLYRVAYQEIDTKLLAKYGGSDLVQQTLFEASQGFNRFRGQTEEDLRAWLLGILKNNLQDNRRHFEETRKRAISRETGAHGHLGLEDAAKSPSDSLILQERIRHLEKALDSLDPRQQELIRLRQQEKQTFAEIGVRLGWSEEAARKQWTRALEELRTVLGEN